MSIEEARQWEIGLRALLVELLLTIGTLVGILPDVMFWSVAAPAGVLGGIAIGRAFRGRRES